MKKKLLLLLFSVTTTFNLISQTLPEISIDMLGNDNITSVNIQESDKMVKSIGQAMDVVKKEFVDVPPDQKIVIVFISHKTGTPTVELYSRPKLSKEKEKNFFTQINALHFENTLIVDFPILINVNVKPDELSSFTDLVLPTDRLKEEYIKADLKKKYELNKSWAINEMLPILSAFEVKVDDQFAGVKNVGTLVSKTDFSKPQDSEALTSKKMDYWRATMEMNAGNQLIPATKIGMLVAQGEFDQASKYLEIINLFSDPKSVPTTYLNELTWRLNLFTKELNVEIGIGIEQHDKGKYQKAITIYRSILESYPNSAGVLYELYYSQNALDIENKKIEAGSRTAWDKAKGEIYRCNPVYTMDVRASNAKEGYLLFRRQSISELFKEKDQRLKDIYKYADIAMDLGVYDFAAQLFWLSFTFDKEQKEAANKFLYCLDKLGEKKLKDNFKGDFEKIFKKIDKDKEEEMKESQMYKAFKE